MDDFIGTIRAFAFNFAPRGWAECNGQLLPISQNDALFSLIGTTYGGDGRTTFALPDLRGRLLINQGMAAGLTNRVIGSAGGSENNIINETQMPSHTHKVNFSGQNISAKVSIPVFNKEGSFSESEGNILANHNDAYAPANQNNGTLAGFEVPVSGTIKTDATGGSSPVNNMQPYLTVNYCICLQGLYPSRN